MPAPRTNYAGTEPVGGRLTTKVYGIDMREIATRVNATPTAVLVSTGSEDRPDSDVVFWVGGDTEPDNIGADDVWLQADDTSPFAYGVPFNPGDYHRLNDFDQSGTVVMTAGGAQGAVFVPARSAVLTQLGVKITSAGSAGSVIRFGLFELSGVTATLVADFGTVVGTSTGVVTKSGTAPMTAGKRYFAVAVAQGGAVTQPTVQMMLDQGMFGVNTGIGHATASLLFSLWIVPRISGVSGALASGTIDASGNAAPAIVGLCAS